MHWTSLRYSVYIDHILYQINLWSEILNHDIILKLLSNKNTPPKKFSCLLFNSLQIEFDNEV